MRPEEEALGQDRTYSCQLGTHHASCSSGRFVREVRSRCRVNGDWGWVVCCHRGDSIVPSDWPEEEGKPGVWKVDCLTREEDVLWPMETWVCLSSAVLNCEESSFVVIQVWVAFCSFFSSIAFVWVICLEGKAVYSLLKYWQLSMGQAKARVLCRWWQESNLWGYMLPARGVWSARSRSGAELDVTRYSDRLRGHLNPSTLLAWPVWSLAAGDTITFSLRSLTGFIVRFYS